MKLLPLETQLTIRNCWRCRMTVEEFDYNDRIDMVDARRIIEIVTALAKSCAFNHAEATKIAGVCQECCERLEKEQI